MTEEKQNNPSFAFKSIPLGQSVELILDCAQPAKTGESRYGTWNLWFGMVNGVTVTEGRKPNTKEISNYSGKVIFFPATKLNEKLIAAANGNIEVKVKVTKTAKETQKGLITEYLVEKLSDGRPVESSVTPTETKLINEASALKKQGYDVTLDLFIKASQEPQYENKISIERAKKLYVMLE